MPKPPRGQPPQDGSPRRTRHAGNAGSGSRGGTGNSATGRQNNKRGNSDPRPDRDAEGVRDKSVQVPKKPGWARAAPRRNKPWLSKKSKDRGEQSEVRRSGRTDHRSENSVADGPGKKPAFRERPVPGRGHVERPDNRSRPFDSRGRGGARRSQRPENSSQLNRVGDARGRRDLPAGDGAPSSKMRVARAMARAGLCSRRDAERWVEEGRVLVNGKKILSPARDVGPGDSVVVDGQPLPAPVPTRLWRYSKPKGLVTTHRDPEGRPTVFDTLPDDMPRVMSIGRLDYNTEGLLLLTTDGELARYLELPSTGWLRRYRVRAHGRVSQVELDALKDGIEIDGVHYGPVEANLDSTQGANVWLTVGLREGKNREVRKILASLNLEVNRLIRVSFGPFQLLDMKPGTVEVVRRRVLVDQMGARLARQFNLAPDEDDDGADRAPRGRRSGRYDRRPASRSAREENEAGGRSFEPGRRGGDDRKARNANDEAASSKPPRRPSRSGKRDRNAEPDVSDIDETALDDIKPWTIKTEEDGAAGRRKGGKSGRSMFKKRSRSADRGTNRSSAGTARKPRGKPDRS